MEHLFEYPSKIKNSLEKLKKFNLAINGFGNLVDLYRNEIGLIPYYPITLNKGTVIFRARRNQGGIKNLYKEISQIGLKPEEFVTEFGRANIPNHAVFYASTNEETVIQEINQWFINEDGRYQDLVSKGALTSQWNPFTCFATLSAWYVKEDITLALLFGNEIDRPVGIQEAKVKKEALAHKSVEFKESWNAVIDVFSKEFSKVNIRNQYDYALSSLYSYLIMNGNYDGANISLSGVKYASIANKYRGENIALTSDCYRKSIGFIGANYCVAMNNFNKKYGNEFTTIVSKDYSAVLNSDSSFGYIDASDEWDYLMRNNNDLHHVILPNREGKRFVTTVMRANI